MTVSNTDCLVVERRFQALVIEENLNTLCVEFEQHVSDSLVVEVLDSITIEVEPKAPSVEVFVRELE